MSDMTMATARAPRPPLVHPLAVRLTHWVNALAVGVMIASGWQIYNASPLFAFTFPAWATLGGWLGGGLLWHFAAMWLLAANGILMLAYGLVSGRYRKKLLPITPSALVADTRAALGGRLAHDDIANYNAVQKLLYAGVIALLVLLVLSGASIWKPVQFASLAALFGGYEGARLVHFLAMSGVALFIVVHVAMALLVPSSMRAMIAGK